MDKDNKKEPISRRGFLSLGMMMPFLSVTKPLAAKPQTHEDDEFTTMLTPEGKAVKVKKSALKNSKVIEEKISNQSLLKWLKPKGLGSK